MNASKPTACAALDGGLRLSWSGLLHRDNDILRAIEGWRPEVVAIDAPLSLPLGQCCLEDDCPCQPLSPHKGRACERELARCGIGCFYTTKRSIIRDLVYRAIGLRDRLADAGLCVIEAYPYAAKVRLFAERLPRKTTSGGTMALRRHIAGVLPHLVSDIPRFNHDLCDALLCAYTAVLFGAGMTEAVGDHTEGVIWIPMGRQWIVGRSCST